VLIHCQLNLLEEGREERGEGERKRGRKKDEKEGEKDNS